MRAVPMALLAALPAAARFPMTREGEELTAVVQRRLEKLRKRSVSFPPPNTTCDADFKDDEGYDCQLYEQAKWCNKDGSYGAGWCARQTTCASQGFSWGTYQGFRNSKNEDGGTQCAGCGASCPAVPYKRTIAPLPRASCTDYEAVEADGGGQWSDSWGYTCDTYRYGQFCVQKNGKWTEGGLWNKADFGTIDEYAWFYKGGCTTKGKDSPCKITAYKACCGCGGGKY